MEQAAGHVAAKRGTRGATQVEHMVLALSGNIIGGASGSSDVQGSNLATSWSTYTGSDRGKKPGHQTGHAHAASNRKLTPLLGLPRQHRIGSATDQPIFLPPSVHVCVEDHMARSAGLRVLSLLPATPRDEGPKQA